jgi:hypothetical protein
VSTELPALLYSLYAMDSAVWTPYCGITGESHENLIQCPDCHAKNPQVFSSISSSAAVQRAAVSSTSVRRAEVFDLTDSPPSRPQAAVSVSAASKFTNYNREHGAETLRQAHFSQRGSSVRGGRRQNSASYSSLNLTSYRTIVTFSLLQYEIVDDLVQTVNYQVLGTIKLQIYSPSLIMNQSKLSPVFHLVRLKI